MSNFVRVAFSELMSQLSSLPYGLGRKTKTGPHYRYFPNFQTILSPSKVKNFLPLYYINSTIYSLPSLLCQWVKMKSNFNLNYPDWIKNYSRISMKPCFSNRHKYRLTFLKKSLFLNILQKILADLSLFMFKFYHFSEMTFKKLLN